MRECSLWTGNPNLIDVMDSMKRFSTSKGLLQAQAVVNRFLQEINHLLPASLEKAGVGWLYVFASIVSIAVGVDLLHCKLIILVCRIHSCADYLQLVFSSLRQNSRAFACEVYTGKSFVKSLRPSTQIVVAMAILAFDGRSLPPCN
jgi:hypothetical protein